MTQENQSNVEPAIPPGVRLHLEHRGRVLREMEITDGLVERTIARALEQSSSPGSSQRRWLLSPVIAVAALVIFFGGYQLAGRGRHTYGLSPVTYRPDMKRYSGDPRILFEKDLPALTQYHQCKASNPRRACQIGLRNAMVMFDPSTCRGDGACSFYVAERLDDDLGDFATAKAIDENRIIEDWTAEWGPEPPMMGSGSDVPIRGLDLAAPKLTPKKDLHAAPPD